MPGIDQASDFASVELDGRLVGGVALIAVPPYSEIPAYAFFDPDLPGPELDQVFGAILEHSVAAAGKYAAAASSDARPLLVMNAGVGSPYAPFLEARGFSYLRSYFVMRKDVGPGEPQGALPEGFRLRAVDADADVEAVAHVVTAFEDHHGDQVFSADQLSHFMHEATARPDLSLLAADDDGPCALALNGINADGGQVEIVATLRRARGPSGRV